MKKSALRKTKGTGFVNFLDSGSGAMAEHAWRLAENRKNRPTNRRGKFVSVDVKKGVLTDSRGRLIGQPHHAFIQGDVIEELGRRKPNSVGVLNESMFVDYLLTLRGIIREAARRGIPVEDAEAIGNAVGFKFHDNAVLRKFLEKKYSADPVGVYAHEAFRVLRENGRLLLTVSRLNSSEAIERIRGAGFQIMSTRELTETEIQRGPSRTSRRMVGLEDVGEIPPKALESFWPTRISARKPRKGEKR